MTTKEASLVVLVVLLLAVAAVQAFEISSINTKITAMVTGNSATAGFSSYDEMMAAHHGGETPAQSAPAQGIGDCS